MSKKPTIHIQLDDDDYDGLESMAIRAGVPMDVMLIAILESNEAFKRHKFLIQTIPDAPLAVPSGEHE